MQPQPSAIDEDHRVVDVDIRVATLVDLFSLMEPEMTGRKELIANQCAR